MLTNHYYQDSECKAQETDELLSEWNKCKFDMLKWKSEMPDPSVLQNTPLEWTLQRLLRMKSEFGYFFPKLVTWQRFQCLLLSPMPDLSEVPAR